jgi:hypothetical protein
VTTAAAPAALRQPGIPGARLAAIARLGVRRVEAQVPELAHGWRVRVGTLARRLGIAVTVREDLAVPARWRREDRAARTGMHQLWADDPQVTDVIDIRPDLRESARRFALAHEIGHVVLYREFERLAERLSLREHEQFANAFAVELLVPRGARTELAARFRSAEQPVELLRLADALGVSPRTLLRFANRDRWMQGLDVIWFDIRCMPNRYTGRDRRLRVFDSVLDRQRWFVPGNRSVVGAFGGDGWLLEMTRRTRHAELELDISRRSLADGPRYIREPVTASVSALRLRHAVGDRGMEVLAFAKLAPDSGPAGAPLHASAPTR